MFAVFITVVIAVAATLAGIHGTSGRYARNVEASFFDGVYMKAEGYTQPGIATHLDVCANAALGLATLLEKYPELAGPSEDLLSARRELVAADGILAKNNAFSNMVGRYNVILDAAKSSGLSEQDLINTGQYASSFSGAFGAISRSAYNDNVREHLSGQSFFSSIMGVFTGAKQPELFSLANTTLSAWN